MVFNTIVNAITLYLILLSFLWLSLYSNYLLNLWLNSYSLFVILYFLRTWSCHVWIMAILLLPFSSCALGYSLVVFPRIQPPVAWWITVVRIGICSCFTQLLREILQNFTRNYIFVNFCEYSNQVKKVAYNSCSSVYF